MNGIIVGAGRIGYNLAQVMSEKHDIIIIDNNRERCKMLRDKLDCYVIEGTGTNTKILEEANISSTDFFVSVTANDEVNLLSTVYARDHGVNTIIARVNNPEHNMIFKKLNIPVINPEISAMQFILRNIIRPSAQNLVTIGEGTAEILELTVRNKELVGKLVNDISPTEDYIIITIYGEEEVIIPNNDTKIRYEDNIAILTKNNCIDKVKELFTKRS